MLYDLYSLACRVHCAAVALVLAFDCGDDAESGDCYSRFLAVAGELLSFAETVGASNFSDVEADLFGNFYEFFDVVRLGIAAGTEAHRDLIRVSTHVYGVYMSTFRRLFL